MCGFFDNCVGVLVICVLVFTVFCTVCTVFLYCFAYVYLFLLVTSVRTTATSENSIAVIIIIIIIISSIARRTTIPRNPGGVPIHRLQHVHQSLTVHSHISLLNDTKL